MILALTSILAALSASQQAGDEKARLQQLEGRLGLQKKASVGPYAARLIWSLKQHGIIPTMMATIWLGSSLSTNDGHIRESGEGTMRGPLHQEFPSKAFLSHDLKLSADGRAIEAVLLDPATSGRHPELEAQLRGTPFIPAAPWSPSYDYEIGLLAPIIPWAAAHFSRWLKELQMDPRRLDTIKYREGPRGDSPLTRLQMGLYQAYRYEMMERLHVAGVEDPRRNKWPKATDMGQFIDWLGSPAGSQAWIMDLQDAFTAAKDWHDELARLRADGAAPPGVVIASWPDGYTLHRLVTRQQLGAEGETMGHCVGGYWPKVRDYGHVILSLRDAKGKSVATIDIQGTWEALAGGGTGSPIALGKDGHIYDLEGPENEPVEAIGDQLKIMGVLRDLDVELGADFRHNLPDIEVMLTESDIAPLREAGKNLRMETKNCEAYEDLLYRADVLAGKIRRFAPQSATDQEWANSRQRKEAVDIGRNAKDLGIDVEEIGTEDVPQWSETLEETETFIERLSSNLERDVEWLREEQSAFFKEVVDMIKDVVENSGGTIHLSGRSHGTELEGELLSGTVFWIDISDNESLNFWFGTRGMRCRLGDFIEDPVDGLLSIGGLSMEDSGLEEDPPNQWGSGGTKAEEAGDWEETMESLTTPDLGEFLEAASDLGLDLDRNARQALRRFNQ